jgi:RNA polymerase sigma factor (sigma-70 family)
MAGGPLRSLVGYLRQLSGAVEDPPPDGLLLERFVLTRDETAFAELVRRHGPLVWGVCSRLLRSEQDVEDAFQATFLVLARKAGSVRKRESVRSWLYGVARRVAVRAREHVEQRREKERLGPPPSPDRAADAAEWADVRPILDEEIDRLPEKYRLPVILCYLDGRTNEEAARQLGCPKGTVATRLARARERLRGRLVRRGVALPAGTLAGLLASEAAPAAVPEALTRAAVRGGVQLVLGNAAVGGAPAAVALMKGVVRAMWLSKVKAVGAAVLAVAVVVGGAGVFTFVGRAQPPADPSRATPRDPGAKGTDQPDKPVVGLVDDGPKQKLQKLLRERRDAAKEEADARMQEFLAGRGTLDIALEAHVRLLKAELELSDKKEDRIKAHEAYLERATEMAEINKARFDDGKISIADYKRTEYVRLDAEIGLLREKTR